MLNIIKDGMEKATETRIQSVIMQNSIATVEDSLAASYKLKIHLP